MVYSSRYPILVTGGSGHLGQLVLEELLHVREVPARCIITTTRTPEKLAPFAKEGVDVRFADFDQRKSLDKSFTGAKRLLMISTNAIKEADRRTRQKAAVDAIAATAGIEHILMTSTGNPTPTPCFWEDDHLHTELAVKATGKPWTILRNSEYFDFHLEFDWPHWLANGQCYTAAGQGRCAFVSRQDCARAAAAALDSDSMTSACYEITSGDVHTFDEIMRVLSEETGVPVQVHHVTPEQLQGEFVRMGAPFFLASCLAKFEQTVKQGSKDIHSDAVKQLTGSEPVKLRQIVRENKAKILDAMVRPIPLHEGLLV
jgi:NAD(P)H dehydrogenase (quinone)